MLEIPERTLMGPGPSNVPASVLLAMARPTIGHLDPVFLALMDELRAMLRQLFETGNELTLAMSGTGTAGMETVLANLIEPGDPVVIGSNGVFGGRMVEMARRHGADVEVVSAPWGDVVPLEQLADAVARLEPRLVALVHAETSTGVAQPLEGLSDIVHEHGGLLAVDCVTSLGGMPVRVDRWDLDAVYSGTQKCLSCPPGLAPVTLSERAVERLEQRTTPVRSWYLDLSLIRRYWGDERAYHHTAPVNLLYALHEACRLALREGLDRRFARHRHLHERLKAGLAELGLDYVSPEAHTLPMLNAVRIPPGVDEAAARQALLDRFGLEIGGGLGPFKGKVWRIGLMGHSATERNVALALAALGAVLGA